MRVGGGQEGSRGNIDNYGRLMVGNKKVWAGILVLALVVAGAGVGYAQWGGGDSGEEEGPDHPRRRRAAHAAGHRDADRHARAPGAAQGDRRRAGTGERGLLEGRSTAHGRRAAVRDRRARRDRGAGHRCGSSGRSASATAATTCSSSSGSSRPPATIPGAMDTVFTEQTRFALAQWQAQHHYPGATPVSPQSVTVSLAQGSGYTLGKQTAAGLIIGAGGARGRPPRHDVASRTTACSRRSARRRDRVGDARAQDPVDERGGVGGNAGDVRRSPRRSRAPPISPSTSTRVGPRTATTS